MTMKWTRNPIPDYVNSVEQVYITNLENKLLSMECAINEIIARLNNGAGQYDPKNGSYIGYISMPSFPYTDDNIKQAMGSNFPFVILDILSGKLLQDSMGNPYLYNTLQEARKAIETFSVVDSTAGKNRFSIHKIIEM